MDTISLYDDVTRGVYNELVSGTYHFLSVADDCSSRCALSVEALLILLFLSMCKRSLHADDGESLGADVQHGMDSSWVPHMEVHAR